MTWQDQTASRCVWEVWRINSRERYPGELRSHLTLTSLSFRVPNHNRCYLRADCTVSTVKQVWNILILLTETQKQTRTYWQKKGKVTFNKGHCCPFSQTVLTCNFELPWKRNTKEVTWLPVLSLRRASLTSLFLRPRADQSHKRISIHCTWTGVYWFWKWPHW